MFSQKQGGSCLAGVAALSMALCGPRAFGAEQSYRQGDLVVDAGFTIDAARVYAGMPLFVTFRIVNRSKRTLAYPEGGDFRHPAAMSRFMLTAVDAAGRKVAAKIEMSKNKFSGTRDLATGGTIVERLLINQWLTFPAPGTYELTCRRRLTLSAGDTEGKFDVRETFPLTVERAGATDIRDEIQKNGQRIRNGGIQDVLEGTYGLAEIRNEQIIPYMADSLTRGNYLNRLKAIDALAQFPGELVAAPMMVALRDRDEAVRRHAGRALSALEGVDEVFVVLANQLRDGSPEQRQVVVEALAVTQDRRALDLLRKAIQDESPAVRYAALHGIGILGFRDADDVIKEAIKSEDIGTRLAALRGWGELYVTVRVEWLLDLLKQIRREGKEELYLADTLTMVHRRCGSYSASVILSLVDFSDPDPRNEWNVRMLENSQMARGVPHLMSRYVKFKDRSPVGKQLDINREILAAYEAWYKKHLLP